jgi:hypothetical protein
MRLPSLPLRVLHLLDERRVLLELFERRRANQVAALDRPVLLRDGQIVVVAGARHRRRAEERRDEPRSA